LTNSKITGLLVKKRFDDKIEKKNDEINTKKTKANDIK
jgi:hypothetical protein